MHVWPQFANFPQVIRLIQKHLEICYFNNVSQSFKLEVLKGSYDAFFKRSLFCVFGVTEYVDMI